MPTADLSSPTRWLESQRRSRERRRAARHARRRRWSSRSAIGVALASLTLATGGAVASTSSGGSGSGHVMGGVSVAAVQRALGIPADGIFGPQTLRAVKRFQRRHGLTADGIVGPRTLRALGLSARRSGRSRRLQSTSSGTSVSATLRRIALCESGGNPRAISPDGRYRGKYQFTRATWRALGGHGDPAKAPESVQDRIAAKLLALDGTSPWPACG